jgi:hypothetical protein
MGETVANHRTAADLRHDAARCRAMAEKAKDPDVQTSLSKAADSFEILAGHVEELAKSGHWPPPDSK